MRTAAAACGVLLLLAGCAPQQPPVGDLAWRAIDLPEGFVGEQLAVLEGELVVGGVQGDVPAVLTGAEPAPIVARTRLKIPRALALGEAARAPQAWALLQPILQETLPASDRPCFA